jgi:hypothetical protein
MIARCQENWRGSSRTAVLRQPQFLEFNEPENSPRSHDYRRLSKTSREN